MQNLKVGILQFNQVWLDKQANFEHILSFSKDMEQLDLLLLPEMFHTGFSMDVTYADAWGQAEGMRFLKDLSSTHDMAIFTSLMVKDQQYFNRGVFIEPSSQIHTYDKRKAFGLGGEDVYFTSGQQETMVRYKDWTFNLQICYDLRFPELIRNQISPSGEVKYDVLLNVANWPQQRILHWDTLLRARAIENQCYVLACNRVGTDGNGLHYNGHSQAIDLFGNQLLSTPEKEGLFVVTLAHEPLQDGRKSLPFLKDA